MENTWNAVDDFEDCDDSSPPNDVDAGDVVNITDYQNNNPPSRSRSNPRSRRVIFCPRAQNPRTLKLSFQNSAYPSIRLFSNVEFFFSSLYSFTSSPL